MHKNARPFRTIHYSKIKCSVRNCPLFVERYYSHYLRNSKFPNWMIFNVFVASQREICTIFSLGTPPQTHGNIDLLLKFLHLHRCWQIFSSWCRFFLWFFSWFLVSKEPNVSSQLHVKPIIQTAPWDGSRHLPSC